MTTFTVKTGKLGFDTNSTTTKGNVVMDKRGVPIRTNKTEEGKGMQFSTCFWVIMNITMPSIFNTGKYKITCQLDKGEHSIGTNQDRKYNVSVLGHKPGNIHDWKNPTPGKPWFIEDKTYSKVDTFHTASGLKAWMLKNMGQENGKLAFDAFMESEYVKENNGDSTRSIREYGSKATSSTMPAKVKRASVNQPSDYCWSNTTSSMRQDCFV